LHRVSSRAAGTFLFAGYLLPIVIKGGACRMLNSFIAYAHKDKELCDELCTRLLGFKEEQRAGFWSDRAIDAGEEWHLTIIAALDRADVAVLLVSPEFYASEFLRNEELPRIKQRWEEGRLTVVSIRLRPSYHPDAAKYRWLWDVQQVPRDGRYVTKGTDRDSAWVEVMEEMSRALDRVVEQRAVNITSRVEVDDLLADARDTLARCLQVIRQVDDVIGSTPTPDIERAFQAAQGALEADAMGLRDQIGAAYHRLRRCRFSQEDHDGLFQAKLALEGQLMRVVHAAEDAGFPSSTSVGIPQPKRVPQAELGDIREKVESRIDALEQKLKELEAEKLGTPEAAAADAAIDVVVEETTGQTGLARELLAEAEVDVGGVKSAIDGAARSVTRFVTRVAAYGAAGMKAVAATMVAAADAVVEAGVWVVGGGRASRAAPAGATSGVASVSQPATASPEVIAQEQPPRAPSPGPDDPLPPKQIAANRSVRLGPPPGMRWNYLFTVSRPGGGSSTLHSHLLRYLLTSGEYIVESDPALVDSGSEARDLMIEWNEHWSRGLFPRRTEVGRPVEFRYIVTPAREGFPALQFGFLELAGEDFLRLAQRSIDGHPPRLLASVDEFLSSTAVNPAFAFIPAHLVPAQL
jgi:hypothetical protein